MFEKLLGQRSTRPVGYSGSFADRPTVYTGRFVDDCRAVLNAAWLESARLKHAYCGTEHILLGLLAHETAGRPLLLAIGANPSVLRARIELACPAGTRATPLDIDGQPSVPYTSRAKKVLELAMLEASAANHPTVEVAHMVLGVLREEKGVGAKTLVAETGITLAEARVALLGPRAPKFKVQLSDNSDETITDQIVAQVAEGIATGKMQEGERLPTVRSLADELNIAPGTVARAYGELERRGAVLTDGARGTTVAPRPSTPLSDHKRMLFLSEQLRSTVVRGFHLGATAAELQEALKHALKDVMFDTPD